MSGSQSAGVVLETEDERIVVSKSGLRESERHAEEKAREIERLGEGMPRSVDTSGSSRARTSLRA